MINKYIVFLICIQAIQIGAIEKHLPLQDEERNSKVIIPKGKGLVLVGHADLVLTSEQLENINGLELIDVCLPGKIDELDQILSCLYYDKPVTWGNMLEMKGEIAKYYEEHNYPLVVVEVPKQDITAGVLQFVVTPSRVGNVYVEGGRRSSTQRLGKYLELKQDDMVNQKLVMRDLHFMNQNPFRKVDAIYIPGDQPGTTDIVLYAVDRRPYRFYVGADDTGVKSTGRERWFAGFNIGNVFGLDHLLSFQYTTTWSIHNFQAYTLQYVAPLPWRHTLSVYGGYSNVHANLHYPGISMRNHGMSGQASLRYLIPYPIQEHLRGEWSVGGDYKRTNNTIEYTELFAVFGQNVNLTQLCMGYTGEYDGGKFLFDYDIEVFWSPGQWLPDQTNGDYNSLRPGAKNRWLYSRAEISYTQKLAGGTLLILTGRGQYSDANLLPMEQFTIGGYDTVRGYEERQLNYDNGVIFNAEFRTPAFRLATRKKPDQLDGLQFLAFFDYGYGRDHSVIPTIPKNDFLMGIGPGVRYTYDPHITLRLDWGIKLHHNEQFGGGNSMLHFSVVGSY